MCAFLKDRIGRKSEQLAATLAKQGQGPRHNSKSCSLLDRFTDKVRRSWKVPTIEQTVVFCWRHMEKQQSCSFKVWFFDTAKQGTQAMLRLRHQFLLPLPGLEKAHMLSFSESGSDEPHHQHWTVHGQKLITTHANAEMLSVFAKLRALANGWKSRLIHAIGGVLKIMFHFVRLFFWDLFGETMTWYDIKVLDQHVSGLHIGSSPQLCTSKCADDMWKSCKPWSPRFETLE